MTDSICVNQPDLSSLIPSSIRLSLEQMHYSLERDNRNPRMCSVLNNTVLAGGKRFRPLLSFIMGDLFGLEASSIVIYARAIERIHAATLAHDDVIDDARLRRGEPSINTVVGNKKSILAGDYLLAQVLMEVAQHGGNRLVHAISEVIADLVEGEWLQIENKEKADPIWEDIRQVMIKKTGSVIRWCCLAPAILTESSPEIEDICREFGESLGQAFQIGDDILDFTRADGGQGADIGSGVVSTVMFEYRALCSQPWTAVSTISDLDEGALKLAISKSRRRLEAAVEQALVAFSVLQQALPTPPLSGQQTSESIKSMIHYLRFRV